jgi:hypothetical protein
MTDIKALFDQPERIRSPQTKKFYTVIAMKDGAKFAINCLMFKDVAIKDIKGRLVGITLRMIELMKPTGQETPEFGAFQFVGVDKYEMDNGNLYLFRGEKYMLPVLMWPCSPQDFLRSLEDQQVLEQTVAWFKDHVEKSGGKMVVNDATLYAVLSECIEEIPDSTAKLFKLPDLSNVKPFNLNNPYPHDGDDNEYH